LLAGGQAHADRIENTSWQFAVDVPTRCHVSSPVDGINAVCAKEGTIEASRMAASALSLVLEVVAQPFPEGRGKSASELAQLYTQPDFESELPASVCGEDSGRKLGVSNVRTVPTAADVASHGFEAQVVCPAIEVLKVPERRASVRYLVGANGIRYRAMARAPEDQVDQSAAVMSPFMASFVIVPRR